MPQKKYLFDTQSLFGWSLLIGVAVLLLAYPAQAQLAAPNEAGVAFFTDSRGVLVEVTEGLDKY